jgi:regulator of nonsense transcripts 1
MRSDDEEDKSQKLLAYRRDDLQPGRFLKARTNYGENIDAYVRTFRAFVLEEWRAACEEKGRLTLSSIDLKMTHDQSGFFLATMCRDRKTRHVWMAEFEVPSSHVNRGHGESSTKSSNLCVEVGDGVRLTSDRNSETVIVTGRVVSIFGNRVHAVFKLKANETPLKWYDSEWQRHGVQFIPCGAVFHRQAFALDNFKNRPPTDVLRRVILGQVPPASRDTRVVLADASYRFPDVTFTATPAQTEAVNRVLSQPVTLIQGPPGCGKTKVISAIVVHLLAQPCTASQKILVCGTSNAAVRNLVRALLPAMTGINRKLLWLAINAQDMQPSSTMPPEHAALAYVLMLKDESPQGLGFRKIQEKAWKRSLTGGEAEQADDLRKILEHRLCQAADVICCTLETAARECLDEFCFPTVILDEATQAVEPSALIPLVHGAEKFVLVGDQLQLGPVVSTRDLEFNGYSWSLFERLIEAGVSYTMLDRQFRMHPEISVFPNKQFYGGQIRDGVTADARLGPMLACFPNRKVPMLFFDCSGEESQIGRSIANLLEAKIVSHIIHLLMAGGVTDSQIGVITPYRAQVQVLESMLRPHPSVLPGMKIATVDSFQGGESDYIVMSCVRNGPGIGFVKDERRMNVLLTRARYGLVIVGSQNTLSRYSETWYALCFHFKAKGAMVKEFPRSALALHSKR